MSDPTQITVSAADLFVIASQQYGDPTLWTAIAAANGLSDPWIPGTMTLTIPASPVSTDGILYT